METLYLGQIHIFFKVSILFLDKHPHSHVLYAQKAHSVGVDCFPDRVLSWSVMRIERFGNLNGWSGTSRTIRHMQRLVRQGRADPTIIKLATELIRPKAKRDFKGQAESIFNFVKSYIKYVRDPRGVELLRSPLQVLAWKAGDCDDQVILFSSLCEAVGMETRFKTVKANAAVPNEFSHVYSQVNIPSYGWMSADTIVESASFGWETEGHDSATWGGMGQMHPAGKVAYHVEPPWERPREYGLHGLHNIDDYFYREVPDGDSSGDRNGDVSELSEDELSGDGMGWDPFGTKKKARKKARKKAAKALNASFQPLWDSPQVKWMFELHRRIMSLLESVEKGTKPKVLEKPAIGAIDPITREVLAQDPYFGQWVVLIDDIISGLAKKAVADRIDKYGKRFIDDVWPKLKKRIEEAAVEFKLCGGQLPGDDPGQYEVALQSYIDEFRKKYPPHETAGWIIPCLSGLSGEMAAFPAKLKEVRALLSAAQAAQARTTGAAVAEASETITKDAVESGVVTPEEAQMAIKIVQKIAGGYVLTPEEQVLAERMNLKLKPKIPGWLLPAAAAAAAVASMVM